MTNIELKEQIDTDITNKTAVNSITPTITGNNLKSIVDYVDREKRPYKVYTAILNQTGTNDPVAIVLENTLEGEIIWSRGSAGSYFGTLTGAFTENKTIGFLTNSDVSSDNPVFFVSKRSGDDTFAIRSNLGNSATDNILATASLEIRVYN